MSFTNRRGVHLSDEVFDQMLYCPEHDWDPALVAEFERQNSGAPAWIQRWKLIHDEWRNRRPGEETADFMERLRKAGKID